MLFNFMPKDFNFFDLFDKQAAYATLYEALVVLSKLLAPSMPFLSEELYRNLVLSVDPEEPLSVHLSAWPDSKTELINNELNREMSLVMKLASLGHAARNKANRKVRQPLAEAAFSVGSQEDRRTLKRYSDLLEDELNVKHIRSLDAAGEAVAYSLNPLPKQLGQKYGRQFPEIRTRILAMNAEKVGPSLLEGQSFSLKIEGELVEILPQEVEVRVVAKEGFAVANEGGLLAALVTELTPELAEEGLAREFVRRVQDLRKQAGLDIADRIEVYFLVSPALSQAILAFQEYIQNETLAVRMIPDEIPSDLPIGEDSFDGETMRVGLKPV